MNVLLCVWDIYKQHVSSFNCGIIRTTRAVLVAISIPIFNTQLEKSRESVDVSNMRAAYAVAQTDILTEDFTNWNDERNSGAGDVTAYYNLATSAMQKAKPDKGYGKSTVTDIQSKADLPSNATFTWDGKESGKVIKVVASYTAGSTTPTVTVSWE